VLPLEPEASTHMSTTLVAVMRSHRPVLVDVKPRHGPDRPRQRRSRL